MVRIDGRLTDGCQIKWGVRQGCILFTLLFNLYSDKEFKKASHNLELSVKINSEQISIIRYADDTAILYGSLQDLQQLLNYIDRVGRDIGLNINIAKTKYMIFSRQFYVNAELQINGKCVERVPHFKYLGCYITEQLNPDKEIKCRIEIARITFQKMKSFLCNNNLNLKIRQRMTKCYIWLILLYGTETWILKIAMINRLETFEIWLHRHMLRIPWTVID